MKSFTTRNNGDTIQPSHVNDLQDEVNAIEAGLLNGTANLNSSNSTVAALSVTGGSTIAGALNVAGTSTLTGNVHAAAALQVDGNSTINGNVTIGGSLTVNGASFLTPATCLVRNSAKQDIANNAWTSLSWDTEDVDASNMHSTSANSSRIQFAPSSGMYLVGAAVEWNQGNAAGVTYLRLLLNDTTTIVALSTPSGSLNGLTNWSQTVSALVRATSTTDFVGVTVFQNSGSTMSISSGITLGTRFWVAKVQ